MSGRETEDGREAGERERERKAERERVENEWGGRRQEVRVSSEGEREKKGG